MSYALKFPRVDFSDIAVRKVEFIDEIPCTGINISSSTLTFDQVEESQTLTATITPSNTTDILKWTSSDENVASVAGGVVTIHGIGSATITAICGEQSASCTISQTSIKAEGTPILIEGKQIEQFGTGGDSPALRLASQNGQYSFGREYTGASDLAVGNGATNNYEMFKVPYGATTVKAATKDGTNIIFNYLFLADATEVVSTSYGTLPKYLSTVEFLRSEVGKPVEFGQCFGLRIDTNRLTATPDYVYFE